MSLTIEDISDRLDALATLIKARADHDQLAAVLVDAKQILSELMADELDRHMAAERGAREQRA